MVEQGGLPHPSRDIGFGAFVRGPGEDLLRRSEFHQAAQVEEPRVI